LTNQNINLPYALILLNYNWGTNCSMQFEFHWLFGQNFFLWIFQH